MPTYTYKCQACSEEFEVVCPIAEMEQFEAQLSKVRCSGCGMRALQRALRLSRHITFHEGFYEHISADGAWISSMGELKRVARENGNYSGYAQDMGSAFGAKEGRWI